MGKHAHAVRQGIQADFNSKAESRLGAAFLLSLIICSLSKAIACPVRSWRSSESYDLASKDAN